MTASPPPAVRLHRAEREFGLLVGAILAALGAWWTWREKFESVRVGFLAVGVLLVVLGAIAPRWLALPYRGWMRLAELLARVVTTLVLAFVYFLVLTPIGVFKRLRGWDPLERRLAPAAGASFWRPYSGRQGDPKHFDRMY
jgi:hypothetical protein